VTAVKFYGEPPPGIEQDWLPGRLIAIEGTDGVGRSTIISILKDYLEANGWGVIDSGLRRSPLGGPGIDQAKAGHTLDPITLNLFYATDFWDRFERIMLPALQAGMVVLADRYIFSLMARAVVRGASREWLEQIYGFALIPDQVVYLDIDAEDLVLRVLERGFDFWESGGDYLHDRSIYDGFMQHQREQLREMSAMADRYGWDVIDARGTIEEVFEQVRRTIMPNIEGMAQD